MTAQDYSELEPVIDDLKCMSCMAVEAVNTAMGEKSTMEERNTAHFAVRTVHEMIKELQDQYLAILERKLAA